MSESDIIKILIACQAGLLAMFVWHLFKCRDTRIDIATIKGLVSATRDDIQRIGPRTHDAWNTAASCKVEVERIIERVERLERHEDER